MTPKITSIRNDTKINDKKKEKLIFGIEKPENEKPGKENPTTLKSPTTTITSSKTKILTIQRNDPKVIKFMGIKSKFKSGFTILFKSESERADQNKTK